MTLDTQSIQLLQDALEQLDAGFSSLPDFQPQHELQSVAAVMDQVALRLQDNHPYSHPLYAGQMMKPPHPIARLAYSLALWINPNNHSLEGGRASTAMERESVAGLAGMFGWNAHIGHLCSGGTVANLEALWIGAKLYPGKTVVASAQAHYTHRRVSEILQLNFRTVAVDACGRMDITDLERLLAGGEVGTVVVTLGTTGLGALDPLAGILALRKDYDFRIHVDAAYGGYFTLVEDLPAETRAIYDAVAAADSIVVDPHKHGLQPYGCGCVLFRDPSVASQYEHQAPYSYFTADAQHLGEISLECSRPGAAAVALWATQKLLPLCRGGEFSRNLAHSLEAAERLYRHLHADRRFLTITEPQLDIVVWAPCAGLASEISGRSRKLFSDAARSHLHLALVDIPSSLLQQHWPEVGFDTPTVTCLRSCLMKPEHAQWSETIWHILDTIADAGTC